MASDNLSDDLRPSSTTCNVQFKVEDFFLQKIVFSVVYMMYQPDHWCKIPGFSKEVIENSNGKIGPGWTWEKALNAGIAYPHVRI